MGFLRVGFAALIAFVPAMIVVAPASADHDTYGVADYGYGANLLSVFETPLALPGSHGTAPLDRQAGPGEDIASTGFRKLDQDPVVVRKDQIAEGSDLAFRGPLMISGSYDGIGLFERSSRSLEQISFHRCPAAQGDVTVSGDYAFVSIDSPSSNNRESRPATTRQLMSPAPPSGRRACGSSTSRTPASRPRQASSRPSAARTRRHWCRAASEATSTSSPTHWAVRTPAPRPPTQRVRSRSSRSRPMTRRRRGTRASSTSSRTSR